MFSISNSQCCFFTEALQERNLLFENCIYVLVFFKAKMARLKQAKEEAETEVADHKTSTEHGFQRKHEEVRFIKRNKQTCV